MRDNVRFEKMMKEITITWSAVILAVTMFATGCACSGVTGKSADTLYSELDYCIAHGGEPRFARQTYDRLQSRYSGTSKAIDAKQKFLPIIKEWEEKQ